MGRLRAALLVLAVACASTTEPSTAPPPPTLPDEPAAATTTGGSAPSPSPSSTLPPTTAPSTAGADPASFPLWMGISIHVEGWDQEDTNADMYDVHTGHLAALGSVAADHGAVLTFELSEVFVRAHGAWDSDFIQRMQGLGHEIAVHADVGGSDPPFPVFVSRLVSMRRALEEAGVATTHVTGICSGSRWVEAALEAGFDSTAGAVEYCLKSLDPGNVPSGWESALDCTSPAECHGPPVDDLARKMYPWRSTDSSNWLVPGTEGLLLLIGESGSSLPCLEESTRGGACEATSGDTTAFVATLHEYLAGRSQPRRGIIALSWSIGSPPPGGFADEFFSAIDPYVAAGDVEWAGLSAIAAATG